MEVICIDSLDPGIYKEPPSYLNPKAEYCFADLRYWRPDSRFDNVEVVVHLAALGGVSRAAREPENIISGNCGGTARLAEVAGTWPRLRTLMLVSSFSVYGANFTYRCKSCGCERNGQRVTEDLEAGRFEVMCQQCDEGASIVPIKESATPGPMETYAASKYMQELCFRGFTRCPVYILRLSSAYGKRLRPDDGEATIIAKIAGWIRANKRPKLFEDGRQIRDFVYLGDVIETVLALISGASVPQIINVCSGDPTTLIDACHYVSNSLGKEITPEVVGRYRKGDMRHCLGDPSILRGLLGRDPVPFKEGAALVFGGDAFCSLGNRLAT
jgi:dTDP-L-rhamnose 4-epimerase